MKMLFNTRCSRVFQMMAIVALMSCLNVNLLFATSYAQRTRLSLKLSNTTIREVFNSIEQKSEYVFFYPESINSILDKRVSVVVMSETIDVILSRALENSGLTYKLNDRQVIISPAPVQKVNEKKIKINGKVMDDHNNPLPGVNILIKGTSHGTTTDIDGNYFIDVPDKNSVLVFQFVGFDSREVKVGSQININVNLQEIANGLDEVVVVGYGAQKKASVIGSITTLEPQKLQAGTSRSLTNNLAGQLAGVIAVQRSGETGYDNSDFWIRGISTFSGSKSPLVLIDGIERSLNDLDPAEIESFSILKDAAASSVYGVRGANGVVLVNTKRGKMGKPTINVRFEQGFTQPVRLPEYIGSVDYLELLNEISMDREGKKNYSEELIDNYRYHTDSDLYPDVNWMDLVTRDHASNSRANMSISGGSDILRYSIVASYYGEHGILENDNSKEWNSSPVLRRYNIRSNVDVNLTPTTLLRVNIGGYLQDHRRAPVSTDDVLTDAFDTPPFIHPAIYSTGEIPKDRENPWAKLTQSGYEDNSSSKIESLFSVEQDLKFVLPGLKFKGIFSFDRYSNSGVKRSKSITYYHPATQRNEDGSLDLEIKDYGQEFLGYEQTKDWGNKSTYVEANLSYSKIFGSNAIDAMLLYNQRDYNDGSSLPYRNQGIAGRLSYAYDSRYVAEFNFGYNGSENFRRGRRFGFFPSVAVGWLMSEEKFMEPVKNIFSKIKFRFSHGLVGNDRLDGRRFAYITTINSTDGYKWGKDNGNYYERGGYWEGDYGIPDMTWETVAKTNYGLELNLCNALELQLDYFTEKRRDIFMKRSSIPTSAGFVEMPWANYGKVNNQGFEVALAYNKQFNKDWFLNLRGNFTFAKNEIIEYDEPAGVIGTNRARTGHPVGQLYGLIAEGLFTEDDFADVEQGILKDGIPTHTFVDKVRPGDIKYKDVNGDNVVDNMDESPIGGTEDPQIVYGFGMTLQYKNFDLSCFFQGNGRTYRIIGGTNFIPGSGNGAMGNIMTNVVDRWTEENPRQDVFWPRLDNTLNQNNSHASTWWLRNMSMLRMKDIEVGYNFPKRWLQTVRMSNARLFVRGTNLLTFSGFDLWDPELGTNNGCKYPIMKSLSFGFEVNF